MRSTRRAARSIGRRLPTSVQRPIRRLFGRTSTQAAVRRQVRSAPARESADPSGSGTSNFNPSYIRQRPDLLMRLPIACRNVLDLGCATGEVGAEIIRRTPGTRVTGVEIDEAMAAIAAAKLDRVVAADLEDAEEVARALDGAPFDGVLAGDILEHLVDPWRTLRILTRVLAPDATIVASLPNVGFWDTSWNVLVRKRWPYRPRGIHDSTHLRFFARHNLEPLFAQAGYRIERVDRTYRLIERPHEWNRYARFVAIPGLRDLLTFQFLVIARRQADIGVELDRPLGDFGELMPPTPR